MAHCSIILGYSVLLGRSRIPGSNPKLLRKSTTYILPTCYNIPTTFQRLLLWLLGRSALVSLSTLGGRLLGFQDWRDPHSRPSGHQFLPLWNRRRIKSQFHLRFGSVIRFRSVDSARSSSKSSSLMEGIIGFAFH